MKKEYNYRIESGYMPFGEFKTYYRIAEPVGGADPDMAPLVLLHGGPGSTHTYFELLDKLAETGRTIISYDQLGCGNSYVSGHPKLWTMDTWIMELEALRRHLGLEEVHLLGQSFGGMLALAYVLERWPQGVRSLILSSTLPNSQLWGAEQHRMIRYMSKEDQEAIETAERTGQYDTPEYLAANERFMELHCAGKPAEDAPECLRREKKYGDEAYRIAWGPNEYTPIGTLRDFDYTDELKHIKMPCLIISGTEDMCTPLIAKTMYDRLPHARWELFENARHMCFAEQTDRYLDLISAWMEEKD